MYEGKITDPILVIHPGRYRYASLRYISANLELGHVLFYGADITEYEELDINKNNLVGSLDFVIPENRDMWRILLNNNSLARFSVNEKLGLVLYRQGSEGCFIMKFINILPEYRYTNRRTPSEYISSFTGQEYPEEEPEDGDTRPIYAESSPNWQDVVQKYKPEEEEKDGGCCTVQ